MPRFQTQRNQEFGKNLNIDVSVGKFKSLTFGVTDPWVVSVRGSGCMDALAPIWPLVFV